MHLKYGIMLQTKKKLKLNTLFDDPALKACQIQSACERLMQIADLHLEGFDVVISSYYSISSDGLIRIPWNFLV